MLTFSKAVKQHLGSRVLGPEFPLIPRLRNQYQMELLIKLETGISLSQVKQILYESISLSLKEQESRLQIIYDVDPY